MADQFMNVSVAYATPAVQKRYYLELTESLTVQKVIEKSGVIHDFPEINLSSGKVGIYGEIVSLQDRIGHNDRIEIYRPLLIDPKKARAIRAERKRQQQNLSSFGA